MPVSSNSKPRWMRIVGVLFWVVLLMLWILPLLFHGNEIAYSDFKAAVAQGRVTEVAVSQGTITGQFKDGKKDTFETVRVDDADLYKDLAAHGVKVVGIAAAGWKAFLPWLFPLLALFLFFGMTRVAGPRQGLMSVGRTKAKVYVEHDIKVRFGDVAGVDEAKAELQEVISFLKTPEKYRRLGGKIPKGVLLVGPPGTGKTLLARAVAGEAGVPFFSISGSEFVEMFVGVGAARVRDLFEQAKNRAPCIIFIDELDALGKARGAGPMAHEEREQTLNQLLVELDGFDTRAGVILMAATNRPEILDPALLRAGRFDRHVLVDRPDRTGRLAILQLHARSVPLEDPSALEGVAAMTAGMVGADMANIVNEAALLAVRRGKDRVGRAELEEAVERVIAGLEKRNRVLSKAERERVAHHEVGHALVALVIPGSDPVKKISIIPRGISALGYTMQTPTEDRFLMTQSELENRIATLLGGRVAEALIYDEVSTGAQDDLQKATSLAESMVTRYGMSPKVGQVSFQREDRPLFLGNEVSRSDVHSEELARVIDSEVRRIICEQHARVTRLLQGRLALLKRAAAQLLAHETITGAELQQLQTEEPAPRPAAA